MVNKSIIGAACACLAVVSINVSANVIPTEADWKVAGDGLITYDANTGLEWLDLTVTAGMTHDDVFAQLGSGGAYEGWHFASTSQVSTLWDNFGGSGTYTDWSIENNNLFKVIAPLMGDLYCELSIFAPCEIGTGLSQYITSDIYPSVANSYVISRMQDFTTNETLAAESDFFSLEYTYTNNDVGTYGITAGSALIRVSTVPIPSALWLFGSGLIGLIGFAGRRANA